jgi:hypothetical protein
MAIRIRPEESVWGERMIGSCDACEDLHKLAAVFGTKVYLRRFMLSM